MMAFDSDITQLLLLFTFSFTWFPVNARELKCVNVFCEIKIKFRAGPLVFIATKSTDILACCPLKLIVKGDMKISAAVLLD